ncbi:hypothetical protein [Roseateles saccharophilus]|uniref:SPOR domain-containing protein n=1 Tax=Roseateles saccharophilus TaxID=304 RepID=A0A4R3UD63_ROSSA|nr:hypothetical protein [Roseateles saccharophilus]MDG0835202.1 hypothetical protein [Roseateles saccharophilus]TCU87134.1 hypothetical protein EV671_10446 [Roseateles saccharophilus]
MERLAEQIVDWHNRHPLARRIAADDVHTIGVVALPFVRASAQAGGVVEPVLTDVVSAFDAMHEHPPQSRWSVLVQRAAGLARRLKLRRQARTQWRAFNEKFLPGLSPARIERFALAHGFAEPPATPETRPWRVIVIDETLAGAHGGWPFELYLMSAGIDAGRGRSRVLTGRGIPSQVIGRRIWDPLRLGLAAGVAALLAAGLAWALWPRHEAPAQVEPPAAAASSQAPAPASAIQPPALPASSAEAASTPASASEAAARAPEAEASAASQPDIRPHLVRRSDGIARPPLLSSKPASAPADKAAEKSPGKSAEKSAETTPDAAKMPEPADPRLERMAAAPGQTVVALVGPAGSKADAEALLKKMKAGLVGVYSNPDALQADVIQTPEGWRATIWPFPSREQAQLINATLVARGMKTKAVNF